DYYCLSYDSSLSVWVF
nr:immunoglobulin light chain junction region [Macaca mulatta]MOY15467.1 immunoglobulin light chain junction region [Macaca mulatta]MOY15526.1 immunoglobulin light chain junction region [Macaca mulatta]MOY15584.1 immunoglobulin light chain junction region [Macaca mulatta]MOY15585.1 immunoglobulin light chain junction region [Macaca mulatta]